MKWSLLLALYAYRLDYIFDIGSKSNALQVLEKFLRLSLIAWCICDPFCLPGLFLAPRKLFELEVGDASGENRAGQSTLLKASSLSFSIWLWFTGKLLC